MFTATLVTLALSAALSFAGPAKRAPALEVSLTAPTEVASIGDIKVTAAVTNTGSEAVRVLKYGTVLDGALPTRSFKVFKDGVEAAFTGIKVQLDMSTPDESSFVVIPAGETVLVDHDVSALYDFEALGAGAFDFEPLTTFQFFEDAGSRPNAYKVSAQSFKVNVKSDVKKRELAALEKRATVSCSNASQRSFIAASYTESKSLASIAANYISSQGAGSLFRAYFGTSSTSTVRNVFTGVANENTSGRTMSCTDPYGVCNGNVIAYTLLSGQRPIYFCSIFFNEVASTRLCSGTTVASRNVRGGTTLHEMTHAVSGTDDIGYGCSYDQQLAAQSPSQARINADNYNCFATQVYQNTQC